MAEKTKLFHRPHHQLQFLAAYVDVVVDAKYFYAESNVTNLNQRKLLQNRLFPINYSTGFDWEYPDINFDFKHPISTKFKGRGDPKSHKNDAELNFC